jgi:DNA-3-methyladenine glycosylase
MLFYHYTLQLYYGYMSDFRLLLTELSAPEAAKRLLGCELVRTVNGNEIRVRIVETEAYHQSDAASHSYSGRSQRNDVMFGPAGHLYVYFTYGMHYCCNIVTGPTGEGSAVLIRAVEPLDGEKYMRLNRPKQGIELSNGPAKLCQALNVRLDMNGHDLQQDPLRLIMKSELDSDNIVTTTRVGISKAMDVAWRFYVKDNPYVSKL